MGVSMRVNRSWLTVPIFTVGLVSGVLTQSNEAHAVCRNFEASHNGTDMFHPTGAEGAAINKLMGKVDSWQRQNNLKSIRMTRVRTKCGPWFTKYLLPHRHCVAKARACGRS